MKRNILLWLAVGFALSLLNCTSFWEDEVCNVDAQCPDGMTCTEQGCVLSEVPPDPVCESHTYSVCEEGDAIWYDSCARRQELREQCGSEPCLDGECLRPNCEDGRRNAQETDVDCSGDCLPCVDGAGCLVGSDCQTGVCRERTCQVASCDDAVINGDESDVDCGGSCDPCGLNRTCGVAEDCESNTCQEEHCVAAWCSDGEKNGFETGLDCGGGECGPCEGGGTCVAGTDCVSRHCETGVCLELVCPDGMARVGNTATCVDYYEATLFSGGDCGGEPLGTGDDDLPSEFPDNVASDGCEGICQGTSVVEPGVEMVACSVRGALPSAHVTWFQARRACENSGKHLCRLPGEWRLACGGAPIGDYPYGDSYQPGLCNGGEAGNGMSVPVGSMPGCHGRGFGESVYDMSGNVWEWTDTCSDGCFQGGGAFSDITDYLSCEQGTLSVLPGYSGRFTGFRCCWSPEDSEAIPN